MSTSADRGGATAERNGVSPGLLDWGIGHYETTAAQLEPAARIVVERAAVQQGEHVLDLGCGTGNAALLAAGSGVRVTGVDPAPRLLEVARARAEARGASVTFELGEAASLPLEDRSVDVIVSVFALIFARDAAAAAAEMSRVLAPGDRIVFSAWQPAGVIYDVNSTAAAAVMRALGAPAPPPGFPWQDRDAVGALFAPYGFRTEQDERTLQFNAGSVDDYLETEQRNHPMAVTGMSVLGPLGEADALRARLHRILTDGNEDPSAFRATSRYVVNALRRGRS